MGLYLLYFMLLLVIPLYAQMKVKSTYAKYAKVRSTSGMTGAQVARAILDANGLQDVRIAEQAGTLSDHYDPLNRVVTLSSDIYRNASVAGTAVAAHEVGHAIQHKEGYAFLKLRHALVPAVNISSNLSWIFVMIGLISTAFRSMLLVGIVLLAVGVLFQLVTLPVEFDASRRAMVQLSDLHVVTEKEYPHAKRVLSAAAMTYVAAAAVAAMELVRLLLLYSGLNRSN